MYKVMIVDDEAEIRKSVIMKMDWNGLGLAVAQEASNGIEALEILESEGIDILITDMNMPFMDGVEFLKQCSGRFPEMKRIVLTGYNDMQYIKAAIHSKACDFLLKPIIRQEMIDTLSKVIDELDQEKKEEQTRKNALLRMSEYQDSTVESLILKAVKEEWDPAADIGHKAKQLQMELWLNHRVQFMCVEIANRQEDEERKAEAFRLPFELLCRECKVRWPVLVFRDLSYPNMMQFIYPLQETEALTATGSFEKDIKAMLEKYLRLSVFTGIGEPVSGLKEWRKGYLSALLEWGRRNSAKQPDTPSSADVSLTIDQAKLLSHFLKSCEPEPFQASIREILEQACTHSKQTMIRVIFQIVILIETTAYSNGAAKDQEQYFWLQPEKAYELATVSKAVQFLGTYADKVMKEIKRNAHAGSFMIEEIKNYIDENYANNVSLGMLAGKYHFNASYFSELFKIKMGQSFMDYLNGIRMNKAAQLLLTTSLRTADIAELAGFSNASYFSTVFKKYFGLNPSEFRSVSQ